MLLLSCAEGNNTASTHYFHSVYSVLHHFLSSYTLSSPVPLSLLYACSLFGNAAWRHLESNLASNQELRCVCARARVFVCVRACVCSRWHLAKMHSSCLTKPFIVRGEKGYKKNPHPFVFSSYYTVCYIILSLIDGYAHAIKCCMTAPKSIKSIAYGVKHSVLL